MRINIEKRKKQKTILPRGKFVTTDAHAHVRRYRHRYQWTTPPPAIILDSVPEVLKIRAPSCVLSAQYFYPRNRTYLFVGIVHSHLAGDHFVQADGRGDDKIFGFGDVHPSDERYVGHQLLRPVEHQTAKRVRQSRR